MSVASRDRVETVPEGLALADARLSVTWRELDDVLNRAVNALLSLGLPDDRRVAVFAENSAETVMAYLTGLLSGLSVVPVNSHLRASELAYILGDGQVGALFVGPENAEIGLEAARSAGVATVVGWRSPEHLGLTRWETWLGSSSPEEPPSDMVPHTYLFYTSGTTGQPKGTLAPKETFSGGPSVAEMFADWRVNPTMRRDYVSLGVGPLYHNGPQHIVRVLGAGSPVVVLGRFDPEKTLAAIERYRVANVLMVPTHFSRLLALPKEVRDRYDVSSLEFVGHTGAACPPHVKRAMIEWFGPVLLEAYGGTESGTTNMITSSEWLAHPGSVGKTLPKFELVIVDENDNRLGAHHVGRIYFRDTTGRGIEYFNTPEKTAAAHLEPGVFTLGDIGYFDEDGYLYITDRAADMVVSGGVNIYPAEAEHVLRRHPAVADVAVIAVPNEEMGEELKALVVAAPDGPPIDAAELIAWCRVDLASYKCPKTVDIVADLGRTAMGKLDKRALRAPYWPSQRTIGG